MNKVETIRLPPEPKRDVPHTLETVTVSLRPLKKLVDRTRRILITETDTAPAFESRRKSVASAERRIEHRRARAYDTHRAMLLR
jgi:hypothetical protein